MARRPVIYISQILSWADAFRSRHGRWQQRDDGIVEGGPGMTWCAVDQALAKGHRGLVSGQSLAKLFLARRRKRHRNYLPDLSTAQILTWADAHHRRTGTWPRNTSGSIPEAKGETWKAIQKALIRGRRGLPGGSSLAQFLEAHRGVRNHLASHPLTIKQILTWADDHQSRTGGWPTRSSGAIHGIPDETWPAVDAALIAGSRGLPGGDSLARLLAGKRGVRNLHDLPALSVKQIRSWAEAHQRRTGQRPRVLSGPILDAPGETWAGVNQALVRGGRGLPGGSSLYKLLCECCGPHRTRLQRGHQNG